MAKDSRVSASIASTLSPGVCPRVIKNGRRLFLWRKLAKFRHLLHQRFRQGVCPLLHMAKDSRVSASIASTLSPGVCPRVIKNGRRLFLWRKLAEFWHLLHQRFRQGVCPLLHVPSCTFFPPSTFFFWKFALKLLKSCSDN